MCSTLSMPADYEMLVSHSPPVFSHSPPRYLSDYSPYSVPWGFQSGTCRTSAPNSIPSYNKPLDSGPTSPRRPCLVLRTDFSQTVTSDDPLSPTKLKKRVVFADDRGIPLTQVRIMSGPSNAPPVFTNKFLAQVTKGLTAEVAPEPWEVTFAQPASDYVDFRRRLEQDKVSLENVIVKETEECVIGTIKVRNIAFDKEVIVRSSSDDWTTHEDTFCKFVDNNLSSSTGVSGHYVLYDTFSFRLILPPRSRKIEFCVCFRCEGLEYWDNNSGKNYVLLKKIPDLPKPSLLDDIIEDSKMQRTSETNNFLINLKCADALHAKVESWSEFASWNHLETTGPYW